MSGPNLNRGGRAALTRVSRSLTLVLPTALLVSTAAAQPPNLVRPVDPESTAQSRVIVSLRPVGKIPYDGVILPVTSPDGRFVATESGRAPTFDTLFAAPGAKPPAGLSLSAYSVPVVPPAADAPNAKPPAVSQIQWSKPLPAGLLLGRAADNSGFLVEAPQPTGARWIGKVAWLTGELVWLVRGEGDQTVNAHAAFAPDGSLAFVRKPPGAEAFQLVVRAGRGDNQHDLTFTPRDAAETFCYPFFSADGRTVAAFSIPSDDIAGGPVSLAAFSRLDPEQGKGLALTEIARIDLGRGGMGLAFQIASALQVPVVLPPPSSGAGNQAPAMDPVRDLYAGGLTVLSPRDGTTIWWDPRRSLVLPFAAGAMTAAPFQHAELGVLLAGDKDLTYQSLRLKSGSPNELAVARQVPVMAGRSIPRSTTLESGVTVVFTPPRSGGEFAFQVLLIQPAATE